MTSDDFYIVVNVNGNRFGAEDVRAAGFGGQNNSGFSLIGSGYNFYEFRNLDQATYWHYPEENPENSAESYAAWQSRYTTGTDNDIHAEKLSGYSVRCTMNETESAPE